MDREDMQRRCRHEPMKHRSYGECDAEERFIDWGVTFTYEAKPWRMDHIPMTPDFTIHDAPEELQLPMFVEIKDYEVIGKCLKAFGLDHKDLEEGPFTFDVTPEFWQRKVREDIARAQKLVNAYAEEWDEPWPQRMLITAHVNGGAKTALILEHNRVTFDRDHPAVSTTALAKRTTRWLEAEESYHYWEQERRRRQIEADRAQREAEAKRQQLRANMLASATFVLSLFTGNRTNKYDSCCRMCQDNVPADHGHMSDPEHKEQYGWVVICQPCFNELRQAA